MKAHEWEWNFLVWFLSRISSRVIAGRFVIPRSKSRFLQQCLSLKKKMKNWVNHLKRDFCADFFQFHPLCKQTFPAPRPSHSHVLDEHLTPDLFHLWSHHKLHYCSAKSIRWDFLISGCNLSQGSSVGLGSCRSFTPTLANHVLMELALCAGALSGWNMVGLWRKNATLQYGKIFHTVLGFQLIYCVAVMLRGPQTFGHMA